MKIGPLNVAFLCTPSHGGPFASTATAVPPTTTSSTTSTSTSTTSTTSTTTTTIPGPTTTTPGPVTGTAAYNTSCTNNVTKDAATLVFHAAGRVPGQVTADSPFTLDSMHWDVNIPAGVFQTGINLGLVTPGASIPGLLDLAFKGSNTAQGVQSAPIVNLIVPVHTDSAGAAIDSTVKFDVPNLSWTALTGKIDLSMFGAHVTVTIGPLKVVFTCTPTTSGPFVSTLAVGVSNITTTTTRVASAAGAAGPTLVSTGPRGNLWIQLLAALVLLDLGYLTLTLRRSPQALTARSESHPTGPSPTPPVRVPPRHSSPDSRLGASPDSKVGEIGRSKTRANESTFRVLACAHGLGRRRNRHSPSRHGDRGVGDRPHRQHAARAAAQDQLSCTTSRPCSP